MRLIRHLCILLLAITFLPACAPKEVVTDENTTVENNETNKYGGTVRVASVVRQGSLFPFSSEAMVGHMFDYAIYNNLVSIDDEAKVVPELAESWKFSEDKMVYTLTLRKDVVFHDGESFSAQDAAKTIGYILQSDESFWNKSHVANIETVQVTSDYEVEFTLKEPDGRFLNNLTDIPILPEHLLDEEGVKSFSDQLVGTGPFYMEKIADGKAVMKRNDDYFIDSLPFLDSIEEFLIDSPQTAWSLLMQGDVDLLLLSDYEDFKILESDHSFKTDKFISPMYTTLTLNVEHPLFGDRRLRQAINMLIDRDDIITNVLNEEGVSTTGPFTPDSVFYNNSVDIQKKNYNEGIRILSELGWADTNNDDILDKDGQDLEFVLSTFKVVPENVGVAGRIKWQLYNAGIRVTVDIAEANDLLGNRVPKGDFEALLTLYNTGAYNPLANLNYFWHSENIGSTNNARYKNAELDILLDEVSLVTEYEEYVSVLRNVHKIIAEDSPAIFLYNRFLYVGLNKNLYGVVGGKNIWRNSENWYLLSN